MNEKTFIVKQRIVRERYVEVMGSNRKDAKERADEGHGEIVNGKNRGLTEHGPRKSWLLTSEVVGEVVAG